MESSANVGSMDEAPRLQPQLNSPTKKRVQQKHATQGRKHG